MHDSQLEALFPLMLPERRAFLVVMRWRSPFAVNFWPEMDERPARTLYDVLAEPSRLHQRREDPLLVGLGR